MVLDDLEVVGCADCGCPVDATNPEERVFAVTPELVLCYECAVRRGGVYDDEEDKWRVAPRLEQLPEERAPEP